MVMSPETGKNPFGDTPVGGGLSVNPFGDTPVNVPQEATPPSAPTLEQKEEQGNFYIDQAKAGVADLVFSAIPDQIMNKLLDIDIKDYILEDNTYDVKRYQRDLEAGKESARQEFFGYKGVKPESQLEKYAGIGIRGTVSEGPLAFAGARGPVTGLVELLHSYTANTLGAIGGETGSETARSLGMGELGQDILGATGGLIAGSSTTAGRAVTGTALDAGAQIVRERKRTTESADKAAEYMASSEIRQVINNATKVQPDIDATIDLTVQLQNEIPGLIIPPAATLAENPIYTKNTQYLLKTNPEFYANMRESLNNSLKAVEKRKENLFGATGPEVEARIRATLPSDYTKTLRNARKRIDAIDQQLNKVAETVRPKKDVVDVGTKVDNLMRAKEEAVRSRLSPQYEKLISDAERASVKFPAESVKNVHQTYEALKNKDFFATFPLIANKLKNEWAPKEKTIEPSLIIVPGMPKQEARTVIEYENVSLREMDSLKREINKATRKVKDPSQLRILQNLKTSLSNEVGKLPDEFGLSYKNLDNQFYKELGIPKNKAEIAQLDSARFRTQAGQYLAKPEQAVEFLSFVGDAGIPVVRDAILLKMQSTAFNKDGLLDPRNIEKFLRENKRLIDTVPGLRADLTDAKKLVTKLTETQARLDAEYTTRAKELADGFYKGFMNKGLDGIGNEILASPRSSEKYLRDIKNFEPETAKMARQAIRATLIEKAMGSNTSMLEFINKNKTVFNQWFGSTYSKDIEYIAQAADILGKIDVNSMKFAIDYKNEDALSAKTGVSFVQAQSVLRDRITNAGTKVAILGSKMNVASAIAKRDSQLMDLLLNPSALGELRKNVEENRFKIKTPEVVGKMANTINNAVFKGIYFGVEGAELAREQERIEENQAQ